MKVITIPDNCIMADPIYLDSHNTTINCGKNSQATIIENLPQNNNTTANVHCNANIKHYILQNSKSQTTKLQVNLLAEQANYTIQALQIGKQNSNQELYLDIQHQAPNCQSSSTIRGIFNDKSTGLCTGKIYVAPNAHDSIAALENKNLLLSKTARAKSRPQLEIYNDAVKCSHGATVGSLDYLAMFYLLSRGIPEKTAREILIRSFLAPLSDYITQELNYE